MGNRQYKVQLSDETIEKLEQLAEKFDVRSGNSVAAEVINDYLSLWEEAEAERQRVVEGQRRRKRRPPGSR